MKHWVLGVAGALAVAILVLGGAAAWAADLSCASAGIIKFQHKSDLPTDAVATVGGLPMSDVGGPFNASDVVIEPAPFERFIDAEQQGCRLVIRYEQGGVGYSHGQIILRKTAKTWEVQPGTSYPYSTLIGAGPGAKPGDTIRDDQLLAFAVRLFKGDRSIAPADNKDSSKTLGVYHGVEVEASGLPCSDCGFETIAVYYAIGASAPLCAEIGGRRLLYPNGFAAARGEVGRFCVPDILVRNKLIGDGQPDDGRPNVRDIR